MTVSHVELPPTVLPELLDQADAMRALRRDIHAHPELCFQEERTADLIRVSMEMK